MRITFGTRAVRPAGSRCGLAVRVWPPALGALHPV